MNNKLFIVVIATLLTFGSVGFAIAAPYYTFTKTIVPETNNAFDIGTSTAVYRNAYITQLCLSGDCQTTWPASSAYPFPLTGNATSTLTQFNGGLTSYASTTIGNGLSAGGLTVLGNATTTGNLIVQGNATSTFDGDITMSHPHYLTAHGLRGDASDGLYITANNYTAVANFGVGNSANSVFNGGVNIDGATRLATSMNGLVQAASGALTGITGTAGQFPYYNGTNTLLATSTIFLSTKGNVGIGTTSPSSLLHVEKDQTAATNITIENSNGSNLASTGLYFKNYSVEPAHIDWNYYASGLNLVSGRNNFGTINFKTTTSGSEETRLTILNNGNVGIGTTSPLARLSVNGNGALENQGQLRFYGLRANSSAYVSLSASSTQTSNVNWTLPIADGTNGQVLTTNGAGNLYFSSGGAGTVTSVTATWPIISSGGTTPNITWGGLSTSTAAVVGNIPYFTGVNTFGNVATTTPSFGLGLTAGGTWHVLGSAPTLTVATSSLYSGTIGQFPYFTGTNSIAGTSTISIATNGMLTIDNGLAGDASTQYGATSHEWILGYDATDFSFAIASSTALGTSNALTIDKTTLKTTLTSLDVNDLTSALVLTGAGGDFAEYTGTSCTNQFVRSLSVLGAATCATVANTDLANSTISGVALGSNLAALTNDATLSGSSYNGSGAISDWGLNLANPNTWTGLQQFSNASSTQFSAASQTFYINSAGRVQAKDTTNGWTGVVSPTKSFGLSTGTTTTWVASTTGSGYSPCMVMPFSGTLRQMRPWTDASFLGVNVTINGSNATPSYVVASTTIGTVGFTAGNTFTAGQKVCANFGTTTTATTLQAGATFDVTETF